MNEISYEGNGQIKEFFIPFDILNKRFLNVFILSDNIQHLVSDFKLSQNKIILEEAPKFGEKLVILKIV